MLLKLLSFWEQSTPAASQLQCYFCFRPWLTTWKFLLNRGIILTRWSHDMYRFSEFEHQKCLPVFYYVVKNVITQIHNIPKVFLSRLFSVRHESPHLLLMLQRRCGDWETVRLTFLCWPVWKHPPFYWSTLLQCVNQKKGCHRETRTGHLSIFKQSSYQCDGRKNGSSSGKLNFEEMVLGRTGHIRPE